MKGAIAAGNLHTAQAAATMLRGGGNAVDAAGAAAIASFLSEPLLASAGGAGMMTLSLRGRDPAVVDFFSNAPGRGMRKNAPATTDFESVLINFGPATQIFHIGRGSAAPPMALDGIAAAVRHFGTLPLSAVVEPAVALAREGVPLSRLGADVYRLLWPIMSRDKELAREFGLGADPPIEGTVLKNTLLAETLVRYGQEGGTPNEMRQAILDSFGPDRGGLITEEDLVQEPRIEAPQVVAVGPYRILTSPRVGGELVAHMLAHLDELPAMVSEADRIMGMALSSRATHAERTALTAPGSTTHISVIDAMGGAASVTLTNGEGSGHVIAGTGVQMNNFLGEEDLNPHGYHLHPPGDSLPSMIAPTVVLRGLDPALVLGSGGSNRIRSAVSQVLHRVTRLGEPLRKAVLAPRVHAEENAVWLELDGLEAPESAMEALGREFEHVYPFKQRDFFFGGVHAVARGPGGELDAAGDPRRDGTVKKLEE